MSIIIFIFLYILYILIYLLSLSYIDIKNAALIVKLKEIFV